MATVSIAEKFAATVQRFDIYDLCQSCGKEGKPVASMATKHEDSQ
jgi:hypothetical protein